MISSNSSFLRRLRELYNAPDAFQNVDDVIEWFRSDPWKTDVALFQKAILSAEYLFFKYVVFEGDVERSSKYYHTNDFPTREIQMAFAESVCFYAHQPIIQVEASVTLDNAWIAQNTVLLSSRDIEWDIPDEVWGRVSDDLWKKAHDLKGLRQLLVKTQKIPYKEARDAILLWREPGFIFKNSKLREKTLVKLFKGNAGLKLIHDFLKRHSASEQERTKWLTRYLDEWILQTTVNNNEHEWFEFIKGDWFLECALWFVLRYGHSDPLPYPSFEYVHQERLQKLSLYIENGLIDIKPYCLYDVDSGDLQHPERVIRQFMADYHLLDNDITSIHEESPLLL